MKKSRKNDCPFCYRELIFGNKSWCTACGASWVPECPRCKQPTWMRLDGLYKHIDKGCGFEGKKK